METRKIGRLNRQLLAATTEAEKERLQKELDQELALLEDLEADFGDFRCAG